MAYIGIDPNVGDISFQQFTGDGSTTAFTLAQSVASGEAIIVTIGNVVQEPGGSAAYTAYANTLTFSAAPANGDVITVRYFGRAVDQPLSYGMQLFKYVATASQTVFTGADSNGAILAFSGTDVDVYLNGVHLDADDFTPSSGNTITLATGASLNDDLVVRAFRAFSVTDTVSASSGGTFNGAVNVNGTVNITGDGDDLIVNSADYELALLGNRGSSGVNLDQAYLRMKAEGINTIALDTAGNSYFNGGNVGIGTASPSDLLTIQSPASGGGNGLTIKRNDNGTDQRVGAISFGNTVDSDLALITAKTSVGNSGDGNLQFYTQPQGGSATERLRIDSSGNLLVGSTSNATASPTFFVKQKSGTVASIGGFNLYSASTSADPNNNGIASGGYFNGTSVVATQTTASIYQQYIGNHIWYTNSGLTVGSSFSDTERMRIDSSGNLLVGRTSQIHGGKVCIDYTNGTTAGMAIKDTLTSGTGVPMQIVNGSGTIVGSITQNQSSTSFNTSSDYRLKTAVTYDWDATTRLKQLNPVRFNFIADADTTVDGFLAHEVQDIVPEAVTGTHNEVDDEGNPVYQGIDQSKLVPLLVKTIQELEARIAALETA